jgi:tryptophan 2,3-dioxygenase
MPLIKPRTRGKQMVRLITRLDRESNETLYAYAQFIGEPTEYVLNQLVDTVLAKDKDFISWRAEHPQSCVPRHTSRRRGTGSTSTAQRLGAARSLSDGSATETAATERV